ncbi:hypothetical protein [Chryseobacterium sp.]|uniref:hypothetical protein n=1 Tax=Chryseobacterium sp. TaxID=1871047 RepID=UPI00388CFE41
MRGIRYFLGATFGAALVFFLISFIFLRPRKVSEVEIQFFLNNSEKILITNVPLNEGGFYGVDERLGTDLVSKTTYFSNRNMSYVKADTYTYFCKNLNKYVRSYVISEGGGMNSELLAFGRNIKDKEIWPDIYIYIYIYIYILTKPKMKILAMVQ